MLVPSAYILVETLNSLVLVGRYGAVVAVLATAHAFFQFLNLMIILFLLNASFNPRGSGAYLTTPFL